MPIAKISLRQFLKSLDFFGKQRVHSRVSTQTRNAVGGCEKARKYGFQHALFASQGFVVGESVCLEIAFFQACAALENPALRQLGIRRNAGQQPAEHIVLLDHMKVQRQFTRKIRDFLLIDHTTPAFQPSGTHSRHFETKVSAGNFGSIRALPMLRLCRQ